MFWIKTYIATSRHLLTGGTSFLYPITKTNLLAIVLKEKRVTFTMCVPYSNMIVLKPSVLLVSHTICSMFDAVGLTIPLSLLCSINISIFSVSIKKHKATRAVRQLTKQKIYFTLIAD